MGKEWVGSESTDGKNVSKSSINNFGGHYRNGSRKNNGPGLSEKVRRFSRVKLSDTDWEQNRLMRNRKVQVTNRVT